MPDNVVDLDVLRPKPVIVIIGGHEIDISFMPAGIVFDVDAIQKKLEALDQTELEKGGEVAQEAFELTVEMCSLFCTMRHPELTKSWFLKNCDPNQIDVLANMVRDALQRSYEGSEAYQKNQQAARVTSE